MRRVAVYKKIRYYSHENIGYGTRNPTHNQIMKAASLARVDRFIDQLADGYESQVGEGGNKLSAGQRQRVILARAIIADPRILILDEATSALDSESEKLVQDALDNLMKGRTSIVIAHRLSTIQKANHIVGRIQE